MNADTCYASNDWNSDKRASLHRQLAPRAACGGGWFEFLIADPELF